MTQRLIATLELEEFEDTVRLRKAIGPWAKKMKIQYGENFRDSEQVRLHLERIKSILEERGDLTISQIYRILKPKYGYRTTCRDIHRLILTGELEATLKKGRMTIKTRKKQ